MNRHKYPQQTEAKSSAQTDGKSIVARLRVPLVACLITLLLQGALLFLINGDSQNGNAEVLSSFSGMGRLYAAPLTDDDEDGLVEHYGIVDSRPDGTAGSWVISGTTYIATEDTVIAGKPVTGDCVQIRASESAPTFAIKIARKNLSDCNVSGGGNVDDGDDKDSKRRKWEGVIVNVPPLLIGNWTILIGANETLTFTTSLQTHLDDESRLDYVPGRWVEVKVKRQPDGTLFADHVRVDDYEMGEIVVRLESPTYLNPIATKYNLILTSTLLSRANIYLFTTTDEDEKRVARDIAKEKGVIWAEVNYVNSVPEEDGYKTWGWGGRSEPDEYLGQSAYQQIRWGLASRYYQGAGVVVAVLDTGVYTAHEQFEDKLQLPSLDVIDDDDDPSEMGPGLAWGHGTHVAGVIAAMAPAADILPVRVLDSNGRGNTFLLAYAIEWATQQPGVNVINLSLGTDFDSKILRDAVKDAIERGIIVVAAVGNSGTNQVQYPAAYPDVLGVTALDGDLRKASFANYGKSWVDIAAPGVGIMSTMINAEGAGYASWSGTSMSTAFVSGAAALVVGKWEVQTSTIGGILGQLLNTGILVDDPDYAGQIGRLLDVSAALEVEPTVLFMPLAQR